MRTKVVQFLPLAVVLGALVAVELRSLALLTVAALWLPVLISRHPVHLLSVFGISLGLNVTVLERPIHLSLAQLAGLLVALSLLIHRVFHIVPDNHRPARFWPWAGFLITGTALPSLAASVAPREATIALAQLLFLSAVLYATTQLLLAYPQYAERFVLFIALGALLSTLPAFVQSAFHLGPSPFVRVGIMRAYSFYGQPNSYAHYLAGVVPLFLGLAIARRRYLIPFAAGTAALSLTLSRGGIVGTAMALVLLIGLHQLRRGITRVALLSILLALVVSSALLVLPSPLPTTLDWAAQQRLLALVTTWKAIQAHPLIGYGPGSFKVLREDIAVEGFEDDLETPHNFLLELWFEMGLASLLLFGILVIAYYISAGRAFVRTGDPMLSATVAGLTGMLVAALAGSLLIRGIEETFAALLALTAVRVLRPPGSTQETRVLSNG